MGRPPTKTTRYQTAIETIGLNQLEAAEFFDIGARTSRRYASSKKLPTPLAIALALMLKYKVKPEKALEIKKRYEL